MSMYNQFKTDERLEREGVDIDYGDFVVTVARAGGSNKRYAKVMAQLLKPHRRAVQADALEEETARRIMASALADTVVLNWRVRRKAAGGESEELAQGIEGPPDADGESELLPLNRQNLLDTFRRLPDLMLDINQQASNMYLFKEEIKEADAGN